MHFIIILIKFLFHSFIELISLLLSLDGAKFVLSECFNQDNVESFFGKQRARCGCGDNPTVKQIMYITQAIRTPRSILVVIFRKGSLFMI